MRSIKYYFDNAKKSNPSLGDVIVFTIAIWHRDFSKRVICKWFNKSVNKNDYDKKDKKEILDDLYTKSKKPLRKVENDTFL